LLAVRYDLQLGAAAELIAGVLTLGSTECTPVHVVTDKATVYPSAIRAWAPDAKHTATGMGDRTRTPPSGFSAMRVTFEHSLICDNGVLDAAYALKYGITTIFVPVGRKS